MRSFIVMAMFVATLSHAAWTDYEEVRNLKLESDGVEHLKIKAGDGSMDVTGVKGLGEINVVATIVVPGANKDAALKVIEKKMTLALQREGNEGQLNAWFTQGIMGRRSDAYIALDVKVPQGVSVTIDDGAGSLDVIDTLGRVVIDDGSGSIELANVTDVRIDDGSGSIKISAASGDVSIVDGSGSITVEHVGGSVTIDDGSGGIRIRDVEADLVIVDDGSGGLSFKDVRGTVDAET